MAVASAGPCAIICTSLHTDNHASTSSLEFLQANALPDAEPTGGSLQLSDQCWGLERQHKGKASFLPS